MGYPTDEQLEESHKNRAPPAYRDSTVTMTKAQYDALLSVRKLARKVCAHHEVDKIRATNPDYVEVHLLLAIEASEALNG